ncbi:MAG TPA: metalloregulator ArsR/SmtB family transcription factor [Candidatus Saccharimonadales bacterium]|nr:metalloregulator ArsR/SmtB family transcription factor [Candidatus Saccharimonadales bacterium]
MTEAALNSVFSALADPTRRGILERLGRGDATVSELAEPFDISLPAISRHLKVLEHAGLIARSRRAQWITSTLHTAPLDDADAWMTQVRQLWSARFDRLEVHLQQVKRRSRESSPGNKKEKERQHAR